VLKIVIEAGAIQINQDSRELPAVLSELTRLSTALESLRAKVEPLVPDTAQVAELTRRMRESTDRQEAAVETNTPTDEGS
jgi:hypothetical protein